MSKDQWDDDKLENLFKQAPKVQDHRTKEDVLQRLIDEGALDEQPPQQQKIVKKGIRWTPLITSIASLFILVFVGSQFMGNNISMENSALDEAKLEPASGELEAEMSDSSAMERAAVSGFTLDAAAPQTLVYPSQLEGVTLFEIGLTGDDAESVPVSFLIPNDVVKEKTGTEKPTKLQLYEAFAPLIDESSLGFTEFHPFKGTFREEGATLIHVLPQDHSYDTGSAMIANYMGALVDTFGDAYTEVRIENEQGEPAYFDHIGNLEEPVLLQGEQTNYNYFAYQKRDGTMYLSPNFRMSYTNATDAFNNLTVEANDIYQTILLPDVTYSVKEQEALVLVTFDKALDLEQYDPMAAMRMIEGMLLTASSFDKKIKFEQIVQENWSGFDFTKPLETPLAANLVFYNF